MTSRLQSSRAALATGPLKFGDPEQIAAVHCIERSGPRSEGQRRRWTEARRRFVSNLGLAMSKEILPCPHCGRLPWLARPACGKPLVKAYGLWSRSTRGGSARWLLEYARAWHRSSGQKVLRMVEAEANDN